MGESTRRMREEITGVQYLRGLAALGVVVFHAHGTVWRSEHHDAPLRGGLLEGGHVGVDLFFIVSGFILTFVSLDGPGLAPAVSRRAFLARRFVRIVPLMWIAVLSYAALRIVAVGLADWPEYVSALLLLPLGDVKPETIWTLRQELIFYLLFVFAMLGPRRRPWLLALWLALAAATMAAYVAASHGLLAPALLHIAPLATLLILFHSVAIEFAAGMGIAMLYLRRGRGRAIRLPVDPLWVLALGFLAAMAFASLLKLGYPRAVLVPLLALPLVLLVYLGVHAVCPPGAARSVGRMLGNASYAIYLFHPHVISVGSNLWWRLGLPASTWVTVAALSLLAVLAGVALHHLLERPLVGAGGAWIERRGWSGPGH